MFQNGCNINQSKQFKFMPCITKNSKHITVYFRLVQRIFYCKSSLMPKCKYTGMVPFGVANSSWGNLHCQHCTLSNLSLKCTELIYTFNLEPVREHKWVSPSALEGEQIWISTNDKSEYWLETQEVVNECDYIQIVVTNFYTKL